MPTGYKIFFVHVVVLLCSRQLAFAQQPVNYAVHANIIYHFTKYIDWPADRKTGDFVIGILGETALTDELKNTVAGKTAAGHRIVVKNIRLSEVGFCHILFISEEESESLRKVLAATEGKPILVVTEGDGLARRGACISFVTADERLQLEINRARIYKRNMKIASELLSLAIVIN